MHGSAEQPPPLAAVPRVRLTEAEVRPIIFGLMLAMFLSALDQTIVATALPLIGRELGDVASLSWVITAYLLSATAVTPLYGKLADIHGRRALLLAGIGVFVAGSIACALARTMPALVLARAVQGLGGGGLIALAQTIIADVVTPKERSRYQAHFGAVFAAANVVGAVLGGFSAQYLHWSLIFWVNVPLGLGALAMIYRTLARLPQMQRRHRLDILGALLMAAATVSLLLALTWGGNRYAWTSPVIASLLAASVALWILFALRLATASEPFLPLSVLFNPVVRAATLSAGFGMGSLIGLSVYVPVYLQAVAGLSAGYSGLGLIPLLGGTVIGATFSGRRMARLAQYKRVPLVGLRHRCAVRARRRARHACCGLSRAAHRDGTGLRLAVPGHDRFAAERGTSASARDRDRRAQLLPPARRCDPGGGIRRHSARRGRCCRLRRTGRRHPRARRRRRRPRPCVPLGVPRRRALTGGRARIPALDGGAAAARPPCGRPNRKLIRRARDHGWESCAPAGASA